MLRKSSRLSWFERKACLVLSNLKYNEEDRFYPCRYNDALLAISKLLLFGRDPIEFIVDLLDISEIEHSHAGLDNIHKK